MFTELVESLMFDICTDKTVFIVGNIKIDMLDSKNVYYPNLMNSFGLHNFINKPSHFQVKHVLIQYLQIQLQ